MQFDWWTLGLQAVNFLALVWLLQRFLYRPVKDVIEKRKKLAEQAFAEADAQKRDAEAARQRFEEARAGLAEERQVMLKKIHEEMHAERNKAIDEAKSKIEDLRKAARESIDAERETALAEIREQVAALAVELASDLLRKVDLNASSGVFLERLDRRLKDLPANERQRLKRDLEPDNARLTAVTAVALTSEERDQWTDRLSANLGKKGKIDFVADPDILGGVELRFPHSVIKFTWADQLRKAKELLQENEAAS